MNIEGGDIETYKTFVVPLDNTKFTEIIYRPLRNDSVTPNKKRKISRDDLNYDETTTD